MEAVGRLLRCCEGIKLVTQERLRDDATPILASLLALGLCGQGGACGRFEDFSNTLVGLGRTLEVFDGTDLLLDILRLLRRDRLLRGLVELLDSLRIISKITLATHENDW